MKITFDSPDKVGQAYIISSSSPETAFAAAREIAMAAVCRSPGRVPCGTCYACSKVLKNSHPDVRVIERLTDDKGKPKKFLTVDQIREVSADAIVLPNESSRKAYIFREGDCLNTEAQNAALKLLEEPPKGVTLLICVTNPAVLLPTVRSRCAELNFHAEGSTDVSAQDAAAEQYLELAAAGNALKLWEWCEENNELSVAEMTQFAQCVAEKLTDMLCGKRDAMGLSPERLFALEKLMERVLTYLNVNTGVKQLFGLLEVRTIPLSGSGCKRRDPFAIQ